MDLFADFLDAEGWRFERSARAHTLPPTGAPPPTPKTVVHYPTGSVIELREKARPTRCLLPGKREA